MRIALFLIAALSLGGCVNMDSLTPGKGTVYDTSYYLLDTKYKFMCLGNSKECRDMTKVVSSRADLKPIEEIYGKEVTGPNYPATLARIIMYPEDQSYQAQPLGSEGRFFQIPINAKTRVVWDTLTDIEVDLFNPAS
ncbi:MAG: hypothetical protein ACRBB6_06515 [Neptuniibacter sp.]